MKKEDKKLIAEKNYPLVGSVVLTLIIVGMSFGIELKDDILTAVNAVLNSSFYPSWFYRCFSWLNFCPIRQ